MTDRLRITLAQLDAVVGDLDGNAAKARTAWEDGRAAGSDLVMLPEMWITGYQTQDLVLKPAFATAAMDAVARLAADCADGPALALGGPLLEGVDLHNVYWILEAGKVRACVRKHHLPNFRVFDEVRLFEPGDVHGPVSLGRARLGFPICEDAWHPDVPETLAETGAEMLLVPNGSPYFRGKFDIRMNHMVSRVIETGLPLIYLNLVGGQDDQLFDGGSFVLNPGGALAVQLPMMEEAVVHVDFARTDSGWHAETGPLAHHPDAWEQDYRVMVEATRGYFRKTGFRKALLGLSGGVDSAIVATIAADALGPQNVRGVMLPSRYTSPESLEDAAATARMLGIELDEVGIEGPVDAVHEALSEQFFETDPGIAEENIQSRLRGLLLMALSNKTGEMLLTTGNKSEVAVGYATIYGDMNGGWNPIKDLYKTRVFETCRWRNANHRDWMLGAGGAVIPERVITKPPSAELAEGQRDEDSLPPYTVLDDILYGLIDCELSVAELVEEGHDRETVKKVERLIYLAEYKRFQSAPGPRLTDRAFWLDRRYPIVNGWRDPT